MIRQIRNIAIATVVSLVSFGLGTAPAQASVTPPTNVSVTSTSEPSTQVDSASARVDFSGVDGAVAYSVIATSGQVNRFGGKEVCQNTACVSFVEGLIGGQTYTIRVVALNSSGQSATSDSVNHIAISVPRPPGSLTSTASDGVVVVDWADPTSLGGLPLTGFVLIDQLNRETEVSGTASTYTFSNLTNGESYTYRIAAVNQNGRSELAQFPAATPTGAPLAPNQPTVATTSNTLTATWTQPSDGGSPITAYVARLFKSGEQVLDQRVSGDVLTSPFLNLEPGLYSVRVQAINAAGTGDFSIASTQTQVGIIRQAQTISFAAVSPQTAPGTLTLNVTATSNLPPFLSATGPCSVDSGTLVATFTGAGTCTVTAVQPGNAEFFSASPVSRAIQISLAASTISPPTSPTTSPPSNSGGGGGGGGPRPTTPDTSSAISGGGGGGGGTPDLVISSITTQSFLVSNSTQVTISGSALSTVFRATLGAITGSFVVRSDTQLVIQFVNATSGSNALTLFYGDRALVRTVLVVQGSSDSSPVNPAPTASPVVPVVPDVPVTTQSRVKATVGSFKGLLAIYIANAKDKRTSIKIAGKWQSVRSVPTNFFRMTRKVGSGFRVSVQVFVDGKLLSSTTIRTK